MAQISFKKIFVEPILSGKKISTIRMKLPRGGRAGTTCDAKVGPYNPPFAKLSISAISQKTFAELSTEDAANDGFPSVEALKKTVEEIYGPIGANTLLHVIYFKVHNI